MSSQAGARTASRSLWEQAAPQTFRPAPRVQPRSAWIPAPVHRLVEPYLPPPPPRIRHSTPSVAETKPQADSSPSSSSGRRVYVRRGVLKEVNIQPRYLTITPQGVRTRLRYTLSVEKTDAALLSAFEILDNQLLTPSTSDTEKQREARLALYNIIIHQFLNRPNMANLEAAYKLFERQHAEGLSVDPKILTIYLTSVLSLPSNHTPMSSIAAIFPFLPETYDLHLLTLILSTTIRHANPAPEEVKAMIKDCIPRANNESKVVMQGWNLELWDVYMGSLLANGQLKEAIRDLVQFRSAAWAQEAQNLKVPSGSPPIFNTSPEAVCRTYISLLSYWVQSGYPNQHRSPQQRLGATRRKNGSNTPRAIACHCFDTLRAAAPPVELLNAWMAAEVAGGNQERAERIWEVISGLKCNGSMLKGDERDGDANTAEILEMRRGMLEMLSSPNWQTGTPTAASLPLGLKADASTYTALFKLLKRLSYPPSRRLLRHFIAEPSNVDAKSLNSALSTIFAVTSPSPDLPTTKSNIPTPDLPAALILLQQFQPLESDTISPIPRTLDIVAAGLLRLSRQGLQIFDDSNLSLSHGPRIEKRDFVDFGEGSSVESRISLREWDRISQELHHLRELEPDNAGYPIMLPVGQPFARLVDESKPQPTVMPSAERSGNALITRRFDPPAGDRTLIVRQLLPALELLLKRAIAAQMSAKSGWEIEESAVESAIIAARKTMGQAV